MSAMRVSFSDFLAEQVRASSLLGLHRGATLADVTRTVGADTFVDDPDRRGILMRRDYGPVEFGFNSDPIHDWVCFSAILQLHRLRWAPAIPTPIQDKVIAAPPVVSLADFRQALESQGGRLAKRDDQSFSDFDYYSVPGSESRISVLTEDDDEILVANSVWSISLW
ncbi:hypothetical protein IU438_06670 [Nocardia cyriacigeorgica]|uniref:hypothetical protein n=1 Tax=Nocardia cyriacigeorgica TaxID=135487 RepID=UPI001895BB84|nr:hypothetical protein [Nocardia cyriacigeorgica]MBF6097208.1 hypothetical protein [Nocardia cyriacigeorgica]MBF6160786.1 hypothetical protein [Nocardia cyriacigeorgica]MBF6201630.1 hypothetical protein [Nocardia cyriacigeorgica]MBF6395472.1 hypothetical protein [Nocardia cyriacigeorgica]MBF6401104.1 hypothetical protein [Nocardia cyriacigeorgica]